MKSSIECNVSQPALTMQLNKIENVLGFKIFSRQRGNTVPTNLGRKVIEKCEQIMNHLLELHKISNQHIEMKIGIIPTVSTYLLPKITNNLGKHHNIKTYFYDLKTSEILSKLQNGEIDCGIVAHYPELFTSYNIVTKPLYTEDFIFVTHKSVNVDIKDGTVSDNVILLEEGNCMNLNIREICNLHKVKHSFAATSIEVIKAMISNNNGYGILPESSIDAFSASQYNIQHFNPKKSRDICLIYRNDYDPQAILKIFNFNEMESV